MPQRPLAGEDPVRSAREASTRPYVRACDLAKQYTCGDDEEMRLSQIRVRSKLEAVRTFARPTHNPGTAPAPVASRRRSSSKNPIANVAWRASCETSRFGCSSAATRRPSGVTSKLGNTPLSAS